MSHNNQNINIEQSCFIHSQMNLIAVEKRANQSQAKLDDHEGGYVHVCLDDLYDQNVLDKIHIDRDVFRYEYDDVWPVLRCA